MSQFRVKESHLAGFSVMTGQVEAHVGDVLNHLRDNCGASRGNWDGVMGALKGPVDGYADVAADRLIKVSAAMVSMGTELNRAAWVYSGTDESAYQQIEVIAGKSVSGGAKTWSGDRVGYSPGTAPSLTAPDIGEADIEAMLDESGGLLDKFNDLIASVTGFSPVGELVKPLSGNWNALAAAGDALMSMGDACEQVADQYDANIGKLGGAWDGAAATSFEGYAGQVVAGLRAEGPVNRTVGRAYKALAKQIEQAATYVVDVLSQICDQLAERAATSWIPAYGQYKLIKFLKECVGIFNDLKKLVEDVKRAVDSVKAVIAAAKDPGEFIKGKVQDKLQPLLDKVNEKRDQYEAAREKAETVRDLASIKPVDLTNVPDIRDDAYSIGKHPKAADA